MNVQLKITVLLLALVAAFVGAVAWIKAHEERKLTRIARERTVESQASFDRRLSKLGEPLEALANDYTYWDDMVAAVGGRDSRWLAANINDATLDKFDANAIWIYTPEREVVHHINNLYAEELGSIPVPPAAFEKLAHDKVAHFFLEIPQEGWMEVRAAVITGSEDFQRRAPARGYLFAGKLWNNESLAETALLSNNDQAWVISGDHAAPVASREDLSDGTILFSRPLPGWDGVPLARLAVRSTSPMIGQLREGNRQLVWALLAFSATLLALLTGLLVRWVGQPLRQISESLWKQDLKPIARLERSRNEFGGLARMIRHFFEQRDSLIKEIRERETTQAALARREEELRHAQKMEAVGRLAGGVAHDFNNLLTAILGYSELLKKRLAHDPVARQNAELIHKAGEQAAAVTYQLLAFSRKQLLQPRVIDLNVVVTDMQRLLRRVIGEHIELLTRPQAEHGRVRADPSQLEQVILNLGVNARDAMPRGGRLVIETGNITLAPEDTRPEAAELPCGEYLMLVVSDTGVGMDAETRAHIFEPFFTTKGVGQGTGLGLATVYGIIKQSRGAVAVESTPGKGSTFRIYLPLEHAPLDVPAPPLLPPKPAREAETVLVVEDEEIVRELVCTVLAEHGYRVECAANGREALELVADGKRTIDLLITDVVMPQMSGPELVNRMLEHRPDLSVLFVSGYSENDISDQGILNADIKFLEKPFTPDTLARKVREVLDGSSVPPEEPALAGRAG